MKKDIQPVPKTELILRDTLALERTRMANQRTFLSFVRTGLYLIVTGLGVLYLKDKLPFMISATILIIAGVITGVVGYINFRKMSRKIKDSYR